MIHERPSRLGSEVNVESVVTVSNYVDSAMATKVIGGSVRKLRGGRVVNCFFRSPTGELRGAEDSGYAVMVARSGAPKLYNL